MLGGDAHSDSEAGEGEGNETPFSNSGLGDGGYVLMVLGLMVIRDGFKLCCCGALIRLIIVGEVNSPLRSWLPENS